MPRYYFHCVDDDTEGLDLPDDEAARAQARETFAALVGDDTVKSGGHMEVLDNQGRRVIKMTFQVESQSLCGG